MLMKLTTEPDQQPDQQPEQQMPDQQQQQQPDLQQQDEPISHSQILNSKMNNTLYFYLL
jgi:hypothetical protein